MPNFFDKLRRRAPANSQQTQTDVASAAPTQTPASANALMQGGDVAENVDESTLKRQMEQSEIVKLILARFRPGSSREERKDSLDFELHCRGQFVTENYYFVREFYSFLASTDGRFLEHAKYLYKSYIHKNAGLQINLPFALQTALDNLFAQEIILDRNGMLTLLMAAAEECVNLLRPAKLDFSNKKADRQANPQRTLDDEIDTRLIRDKRISNIKASHQIRWNHQWADRSSRQRDIDRVKQARSFDEYVNKVQTPSRVLGRRNYQLTRKVGRNYDEGTLRDYLRMSGKTVYREFRPLGQVQFEEENDET